MLSGCENVTDATLVRLAMALSQPAITTYQNHKQQNKNKNDIDNVGMDADEKDAVRNIDFESVRYQEEEYCQTECPYGSCLCEEYENTKKMLNESKKTQDKNVAAKTEAGDDEKETLTASAGDLSCDTDYCDSHCENAVTTSSCGAGKHSIKHERTFENAQASRAPDNEIAFQNGSKSQNTNVREKPDEQCCKTAKQFETGAKTVCHSSCSVKNGTDPFVIEDCVSTKQMQLLQQKNAPPGGSKWKPGEVGAVRLQGCDGYYVYPDPGATNHDFEEWRPRYKSDRTLKYLSLSGCYQITDVGLQ